MNAIAVGNNGSEPKSSENHREGRIVLYASTITGGLYALRLEFEGGELDGRGAKLRCTGFVPGKAIL